MTISKPDQTHGILCEDRVRWFSTWFIDHVNYIGKPSDYINISIQEVLDHVNQYGFDQSTVAYQPLEARYLIEEKNGKWCASFHERGERHGLVAFSSKEEAEKHVIGKLIDRTKLLIDGQFGKASQHKLSE